MNRTTLVCTLIASLAVLAASFVVAGPLDPPSGPVAATFKTLAEVEPRIAINATNTPGDGTSLFRITRPGSYYLTGTVTGSANKHAIVIASSNVSIDLGGFTLQGVPGSWSGIRTAAICNNLSIRNGSVCDWGHFGIDLSTFGIALNSVVERVTAQGNIQSGIITSYDSIVRDCIADDNGETGIVCFDASVVSGCIARANGHHGISLGTSCTITQCVARGNGQSGILAGNGCSVRSCTSSLNQANGITASIDSLIEECVASNNDDNGIQVNSECVVRNNTCSRNGRDGTDGGIVVVSRSNRLDGNHCTSNQNGIVAYGSNNIITRNTCSYNVDKNWYLTYHNQHGPIVNRTTSSTFAVVGDFAPDELGSDHPNANFSH